MVASVRKAPISAFAVVARGKHWCCSILSSW